MERQPVADAVAAVVALSLIAAPVAMADWSERADVSVEPIEADALDDEGPVLRYENLSADGRDVVRRAIESADGHVRIYGREEWPDRLFFSDYVAPGSGRYVVVREGEYYRVTTYAGGGLPFVYWLMELPFVVYGLALGAAAIRSNRGRGSSRLAAVGAVVGVGAHLLGPAFDFPALPPRAFVGFGVAAATAIVAGLAVDAVRRRSSDVDVDADSRA